MASTFTYRLTETDDGFVAKCQELSLEAVGRTPEGALAALKESVTQRFSNVEAVAPPSRPPPPPHVKLVPAIEPEPEPQGPGDSPAAEHSASPPKRLTPR